MKKLLGSALALAMLVPYSQAAYADSLLKNLTFSGKVDVQAVSADNVTNFNSAVYSQIGDAQTRVQLNAGWDVLDNVHAMASLVNNNSVWGNANTGAGNTVGTPTPSGQPAIGLLNNTYLTQAYLKIDKLFGLLDTTLGRQYYGTPGDLVIYFGPQDNIYGLNVTAVDMARFDWSNDMVGVTGIAGKTTAATATKFGAGDESGDVDLRGVNVVVKGNDMWNGGVYIYNALTHNDLATAGAANNNDLFVAGLRGKVMMDGGWASGEFDHDFGRDTLGTANNPLSNYDGWALKLDLGYKADLAPVSVTPWFEFTDLSGGKSLNNYFTPINTDYRPGGIYGLFAGYAGASAALSAATSLGLGTANQIGNQAIWGIGVKATPAALSKLTGGISYWDYRYQNVTGENTIVGVGAKGNSHIGSEIDLNASWAESDNVSVGAGIGSFQPGGAIANLNHAAGTAISPAFLADANVSVKF